MVAPIVWIGGGLVGLFLLDKTADSVGGAADATANLVKWTAIAGGSYVAYRALKASGVLK